MEEKHHFVSHMTHPICLPLPMDRPPELTWCTPKVAFGSAFLLRSANDPNLVTFSSLRDSIVSKIVLQTALLDVRSFQQAVAFYSGFISCFAAMRIRHTTQSIILWKHYIYIEQNPDCSSLGSFAGSRLRGQRGIKVFWQRENAIDCGSPNNWSTISKELWPKNSVRI